MRETPGPPINPEILVPRDEEDAFLATHNIERRQLSNGVTLVGMARTVEDLAESEIKFRFPAGSYHDPAGKEGIHHLLEHLIMKSVIQDTDEIHVYKNAFTAAEEITVVLEGPSNPNVRNFGIWPVLPQVLRVLKHPLEEIDDLERDIEVELGVIESEMLERQSNPDIVTGEAISKYLYHPSNPTRTNSGGKMESLRSITPEEIKALADKVFIPDGMFVGIFTQGDPYANKVLLKQLEDALIDFPRDNLRSNPVDRNLSEMLNPNLEPDEVFTADLGTNDGRVTIVMPWILPYQEFTIESFALQRFLQVVDMRLHNFVRDRGLGYTSSTSTEQASGQALAYLSITVPSEIGNIKGFIRTIFPELREEVLIGIDDRELQSVSQREHLLQKAVPVPTHIRYTSITEGIKIYGRILDTDKMTALMLSMTANHLKGIKEMFASSNPSFIAVGDIK